MNSLAEGRALLCMSNLEVPWFRADVCGAVEDFALACRVCSSTVSARLSNSFRLALLRTEKQQRVFFLNGEIFTKNARAPSSTGGKRL